MRPKKYNKVATRPKHSSRITVEWLHDVAPATWVRCAIGVVSQNWSIHRCNDDVYVWAHRPTHDATMRESRSNVWHAIVVLQTKDDVAQIFNIANLCEE